MKIKKSWIIIAVVVVIIIGWFVSGQLFKSPTAGYTTEKVGKGDVLQEVSETGNIKATQDLGLGFKSIGRVSKVDVAVGDNVKKGDVLAELDASQIASQLQAAEASLNSASQQYQKLVNGATPENIKTYQDAVATAKTNLQSAYNGASNALNDAYTKIYNAYNAVTALQNNYFPTADLQGVKVTDSKSDIKANMQNVKTYSDTDAAVAATIVDLDNTANDLRVVREQCDSGSYYYSVAAADKAVIDTQKSYINTASTSVIAAQTGINSYKAALQTAQDNLAALTSQARPEDVNISQSQISQTQASVNLYQSQLADSQLRSPFDGTITEVNAKKGQVVSPSEPVINLLSSEPFQIKVDIYEQDIVNVKIGQDVKIDLVAFPKQTFGGKVLSIDPGETIIDNVVYYEVTIEFPNQPDGIRDGMTADIIIESNKKENVLRAPKNAVENIDGKDMVQIVKNGKIENQEITTGLEGNDYYEIVSGLSEGDTIITGKQ